MLECATQQSMSASLLKYSLPGTMERTQCVSFGTSLLTVITCATQSYYTTSCMHACMVVVWCIYVCSCER